MAKPAAKKPSGGGGGNSKPASASMAKKSAASKSLADAKASAAKVPTRTSSGTRKAMLASKAARPASRSAGSGVGSSVKGKLAASNSSSRDRNHNDQHPAAGNPPLPQAPVPTNGKPRKNQAGLSVKELEHYRELLLAKRRELVGDMSSMEREALRSAGTNLSNLPMHMADMGTDNYEQEFTLGLVEKDRGLLREINRALAKIMDGTYGICEGTGKPINKARLEAQPWAKYSIEYARQLEKPMFRR